MNKKGKIFTHFLMSDKILIGNKFWINDNDDDDDDDDDI